MLRFEIDQRLVPRHARLTKGDVNDVLTTLTEHLPKKAVGELSIAFVSPIVMRKINRERRRKDHATDVLSFRLNPLLAEVLLCYPVAKRQASEHGWAMRVELINLLIHGVLHTLGFDHETPAQERRMFSLQQKILSAVC